jgi:hypothetical protein
MNGRDTQRLKLLDLALEEGTEIAVLRCTDAQGRKITVAGDVCRWLALLRTGSASDPEGIALDTTAFPVTRLGWPGLG